MTSDSSCSTKIVEALANLEHEQWMKWAKSLMDSEKLSPKRIERWTKYVVPYSELDEKTKEYDRVWARKVLDIIYDYSQPMITEGDK